MSEEQLSALLAKLKVDAGLREKFKGAADLDAAVAIAQEAGFDVSKGDISYTDKVELSDEALESLAGGSNWTWSTCKQGTCAAGCEVGPDPIV
jgi:predicted ribosomally synthesized peptide with nif11-like leader